VDQAGASAAAAVEVESPLQIAARRKLRRRRAARALPDDGPDGGGDNEMVGRGDSNEVSAVEMVVWNYFKSSWKPLLIAMVFKALVSKTWLFHVLSSLYLFYLLYLHYTLFFLFKDRQPMDRSSVSSRDMDNCFETLYLNCKVSKSSGCIIFYIIEHKKKLQANSIDNPS
jgi:hypothetical protein